MAHGLLAAPIHRGRKRKRARPISSARRHRRLEEAGFGEVAAHIIIRLLAEKLRQAGMV